MCGDPRCFHGVDDDDVADGDEPRPQKRQRSSGGALKQQEEEGKEAEAAPVVRTTELAAVAELLQLRHLGGEPAVIA